MSATGKIRLIVTSRVTRSSDPVARVAAQIFTRQLKGKDKPVIGMATGGSVKKFYGRIAKASQKGKVDLSGPKVSLDEYVGLSRHFQDRSFASEIDAMLYRLIGTDPKSVIIPDSRTKDPEGEAVKYELRLKSLGPRAVQILGLGRDGHIAFNMPGTPFNSSTHVVTLSRTTRIANSRFFMKDNDREVLGLKEGEDPFEKFEIWSSHQHRHFWEYVYPHVPKQAITMGIRTVLEADAILMLVSGAGKSLALKMALFGTPNVQIPASALRLHQNVTVVADIMAASQLESPYNKEGDYKV